MFPFQSLLKIADNLFVPTDEVLKHIWPKLTEARQLKTERVAKERCFSNVIVTENLYDRGNISAVMRSAEAFGFGQMHLIEEGEKFKESQRTTAGADKWIEARRWKTTKECIQTLKAQGKQIVVTHLDSQAKPISEIDFLKPTALVLGNEKTGASAEMRALADHRVIVPMSGFVESFNISVAAALCLYQMDLARREAGRLYELNPEQVNTLKAAYALRTLDSSADILKTLAERGEIRYETKA
jgi:tRNA (guanosine-2'-O-)-methyltransferase